MKKLDNDLIIKVDVNLIADSWNPFRQKVWNGIKSPLNKHEVREAIVDRKLILPDTKFTESHRVLPRHIHVEKIAWLVLNFSDDYPIDIDFGIPGMTSNLTPMIEDGNHRFAAAIYLGRPYIMAGCSGAISLIETFKYKE
jgi:hypothetical protein